MFAAFPDGHNTLYDFALQLWSRGGEFVDKEGNTVLDTAEAIAALDFYRNTIRDVSMCYPGAEQLDSTRSGEVVLSGAIAMMVNWFGFAARCDRPGSPMKGKNCDCADSGGRGQTGLRRSPFSGRWELAQDQDTNRQPMTSFTF